MHTERPRREVHLRQPRPALFGEYKDCGDKLPAYEESPSTSSTPKRAASFPAAKKKQNPAWDKKAGRIGEHAGRSYFLLYEPNEREDRGLDRKFWTDVASNDIAASLSSTANGSPSTRTSCGNSIANTENESDICWCRFDLK